MHGIGRPQRDGAGDVPSAAQLARARATMAPGASASAMELERAGAGETVVGAGVRPSRLWAGRASARGCMEMGASGPEGDASSQVVVLREAGRQVDG